MVYFKKLDNDEREEMLDDEFPAIEGFLIFDESERSENMDKRKNAIKVAAVVSAICAAVGTAILVIRKKAKKSGR